MVFWDNLLIDYTKMLLIVRKITYNDGRGDYVEASSDHKRNAND